MGTAARGNAFYSHEARKNRKVIVVVIIIIIIIIIIALCLITTTTTTTTTCWRWGRKRDAVWKYNLQLENSALVGHLTHPFLLTLLTLCSPALPTPPLPSLLSSYTCKLCEVNTRCRVKGSVYFGHVPCVLLNVGPRNFSSSSPLTPRQTSRPSSGQQPQLLKAELLKHI
ncbi:hypothetical protein E2C01_035167 [Portunus trituberculatus]|uniref:Uncharacterized protein n=1 Tax=Portunus trituberculatus TaxID=210409 RepID=A0A5B7F905_PORTR|nr:hypothetical protein [Portunus trituberculatus]